MVLVSALLVAGGVVLLVLGIVRSSIGLIYGSIVCSLGAGVALTIAVVRSGPPARSPGAASEDLSQWEFGDLPAPPPPPDASSGGGERGEERL